MLAIKGKLRVMWIEQSLIEGEHWKLWFANVPSPEKMERYVSDAIAQMDLGNVAYAVRVKSTNQVVGTTRYYGVDGPNRRALIGYTWYSNVTRGTLINKECKYLLLKQLFERYEAIAVEFSHSCWEYRLSKID